MYLTTGSIEDLVKWFREDFHSRYLLSFAAGDVAGRQFFSTLYDHKETVDLVSGTEIAVFVFTDSQSVLGLPPSEGTYRFLPELRLDTPNGNRYDQQITNIHISEIDSAEVKDKLVNSSITFSHQIAQYFDLGADGVPAIVLLYKSHPDPPYCQNLRASRRGNRCRIS